jgi:hypothetical protein
MHMPKHFAILVFILVVALALMLVCGKKEGSGGMAGMTGAYTGGAAGDDEEESQAQTDITQFVVPTEFS